MNKINIDSKIVTPASSSYIIAEIGLNHNKDMTLAKRMIKSAKDNGADAVKFQAYITENLIRKQDPAFDIFKNLELSKDELKELQKYANELDIAFFATSFCYESSDILEDLSVPVYKIASMDLNYYDLIHHISKKRKPVILSTGMSSIGEIEKAVNTISKTGNKNIVIMHCISKYPPQPEDMNLNMITKLKTIFPEYIIGLSDHSLDNRASIIARTLGACFFERHFTLDKTLEGPDHKISITPEELSQLRKDLDNTDKSMTSKKERSDMPVASLARRSIFAARDIKKGEILTSEMTKILRPGTGIAPEFLHLFIGRKLKTNIKKHELLKLTSFQ